MPHMESYQLKAAEAQQNVRDSIPLAWRLPSPASYSGDLRKVASQCGLLSERQLIITEVTASEALGCIRSGRWKAVEVVEAFCIRAAIAHQLVNCLVEFFPAEAIAEAKALDDEHAKTGRTAGPLHGLPMAIKDMHGVKGRVVTMGAVAWLDNPACTYDSSPVKIMRDAGAIFFGRTTMPQTGMALETVSNLWGRTLNPYNAAFGSGGSSGGCAALVAMRGEPAAPITTDIGGSIRVPAAFNGLYAMRPTAERAPRAGMLSAAKGNVSIKVSTGPCCHTMDDLKLFIRLLMTHPSIPYEPTCSIPFWKELASPRELRIGIMATDGVVDPHPPIQRAIRETTAKLEAAGYEVLAFRPPFDLWEAALTTWALYFQTGAKEMKAILDQAGEPPIAQFQHNYEVFKTKELSVPELFAHNAQQAAYKAAFQEAWDAARIDCILCPCAPAAGIPHDFALWWGYTTIWNLLDYPSVIMPVKDLKISAAADPKDLSYLPRDNPFDKPNWQLYEPEVWGTQPVTLQLVGRPYHDEVLIAACEAIDGVVNDKSGGRGSRL
ncbi:hypothetical protein LTR36_010915 [Oleoguttula mirabilis]|uniref:Amidase domain-containing protein n=1 Tax=Oleoguttula mirabilis TaxID=1507867 RepID=A0AAV9J4A3_9PEZI|nr:hypothetical protein LTR36_010915 [Oleoguttula mirabilis]